MPASPNLVDIDKATDRLGISRPTLYRWLRTGRIKGVKIGRQWRVEESELSRLTTGEAPDLAPPPGLADLMKAVAATCAELGITPHQGAPTTEAVVNDIILIAVTVRASDIHIEAHAGVDNQPAHGLLRYRVDGQLAMPTPFDLRALPVVVARFKTMAACNVNETHKPQDGRITLNVADRDMDLRICCLRTALGETVTIRILDRSVGGITFDRFDYTSAQTQTINEALAAPSGLILCTGPTGSGKTSTLYACLNQLANPHRRILTIEDPVEYLLPGMTQTAVDRRNGVTFVAAMRAALRSDPDVIMLAEIRDSETAEICHQAAITGHIVLSALHTNDAAFALMRMIDLGIDPFLISEAVRLIIAQRLLRALCVKCKKPIQLSDDQQTTARQFAEYGGLAWDDLPMQYHEPIGCPHCAQTGYRGRKVVTEMLTLTPAARTALADNPTDAILRRHAIESGMTTILADALRRAAAGQTSLDEVNRLAAQFR